MDITTILIALIVSVLAPGIAEFIKSWISSRARQEEAELKRKEKLEDWVRQDLLAARAADTAAEVKRLIAAVSEVKTDVAEVKHNTNNLTAAAVAAAEELGAAKTAAALAEGELKASAALAQGQQEGRAAERGERHQEAVDIQAAKEAEPPVRT